MVKGIAKRAVTSVGIAAGIVLVAGYAANRFNVGDKILGNLRGFGLTVGQAVGTIPSGILQGLELTGEEISEAFQPFADFSQDIQSSLGGLFGLFGNEGSGKEDSGKEESGKEESGKEDSKPSKKGADGTLSGQGGTSSGKDESGKEIIQASQPFADFGGDILRLFEEFFKKDESGKDGSRKEDSKPSKKGADGTLPGQGGTFDVTEVELFLPDRPEDSLSSFLSDGPDDLISSFLPSFDKSRPEDSLSSFDKSRPEDSLSSFLLDGPDDLISSFLPSFDKSRPEGQSIPKTIIEQVPVEENQIRNLSNPVKLAEGLEIQGIAGVQTDPNVSDIRGISRLPPNAVARKQKTLVGNLTTKVGGTRTIRGSPELFERLKQNLGGN